MTTNIKNIPQVLHIDVEKGWRGGQKQALSLYQAEIGRGLNSNFLCRIDSEMSKELNKKSLPHTVLNYKHELDLISAYKVAKLAKNLRINILNCHSSHSLSLGLLSKFFYSKPQLIGVRRVDFKISNNILSRWKYNSDKLDMLVCVSDAIRNIMKLTVVNEGKLTVIHSGVKIVNYSKFDASLIREEFNLENKFVVGTIAAFVGHKDYPTLLKTVRQTVDYRPDIVFIALGDGELLEDMKKQSLELNIDKNIIFTGFRKDVGEFLKIFDLFILTSNEEGLGSSILDAMSAGLPVIATKAGGIPEIVDDGVNGVLCNIGDYHNLSLSVLELADNVDKRKAYGLASKEKVIEFGIDKTVEKYYDLYNSLIKNKI